MNLKLRNEVMLRELDDEILLYDTRNGEAFLLNAVGAAIVEFLTAGAMTREAIQAEIVEATGAELEAVAGDVDAFFKMLSESDLLETST